MALGMRTPLAFLFRNMDTEALLIARGVVENKV